MIIIRPYSFIKGKNAAYFKNLKQLYRFLLAEYSTLNQTKGKKIVLLIYGQYRNRNKVNIKYHIKYDVDVKIIFSLRGLRSKYIHKFAIEEFYIQSSFFFSTTILLVQPK